MNETDRSATEPAGGPPLDCGVGPAAGAHDWLADGMTYALIDAHDPATDDGWSAGDLARAFAAGAAAAERRNRAPAAAWQALAEGVLAMAERGERAAEIRALYETGKPNARLSGPQRPAQEQR